MMPASAAASIVSSKQYKYSPMRRQPLTRCVRKSRCFETSVMRTATHGDCRNTDLGPSPR